ncbi:MAG: hypothetical protein E7465_00215 [Ruminococcaceae bacterium]|nr:hypothetical protein [Oscillospiraceae bacterium]
MKFDKPDFETTLAAAPEAGFAEISAPVPEPLRRSGADYVRKSKVKIHAIDSAVSGISEITGTVQCAFGIVHHPTLSILRQGNQVLVERYHCGCREGARGHFCVHCAAVLMARYDHADLRLLNRESQLETRLNGIRIRLGTDRKTTEPIYWTPEDPERVSSPNAAVIGGPDTGNTQLVKSMVVQFLRQRERSQTGVLIFDWMGDYDESKTDFMEATGARVRRLQKLPLNPFSLRGLERRPQLHVHTAMAFAETLARAYNLGPLPKSTLVQSVVAAYDAKGITSDPLTWDRPAPNFADVYEEYMSRPQAQRLDALSPVMESLSAFELFDTAPPEGVTLFERFQGVEVIDMAGYPQELKCFAAGIILEQLYAQMCGTGRTMSQELSRMIFIDEADALLAMGCPGLEGILSRSREYGMGVVLATISPEPFCTGKFDWWRVIRTWIVHNVEDLRKTDMEVLLQMDLYDQSMDRLCQAVRRQKKQQSMIRIGTELPLLAEDLPFYEIARDAAQSYLREKTAEAKSQPLEGMPLLDAAHLDAVDLAEELNAEPMQALEDL